MDLNIQSVYQAHHPEPFSVNFHKHSCYELVLYKQGKGTIATEDVVYDYKENTLAVFPPGVIHNEINHFESKILIIEFFAKDIQVPAGIFQADEDICHILHHIFREYSSGEEYSLEIAKKQLEVILYMLSRNQLNQKAKPNFSLILNNMDNYIRENMSLPIHIRDFAKMYHYSPDRFRHIFTEHVKMSPKQYVISKRLTYAKTLLEETEKTVTEIAQECGFYDVSQFSKMFKKQFSESPNTYKKNKR